MVSQGRILDDGHRRSEAGRVEPRPALCVTVDPKANDEDENENQNS
jgi:hypothetical protein